MRFGGPMAGRRTEPKSGPVEALVGGLVGSSSYNPVISKTVAGSWATCHAWGWGRVGLDCTHPITIPVVQTDRRVGDLDGARWTI